MSLCASEWVLQNGNGGEKTREGVGVGEKIVTPHLAEEFEDRKGRVSGRQLRIAIEEAIPGDDVFVLNILKDPMCLLQGVTFCIKVDEIVGEEEGRRSDTGFDEAGVERRAFPEVSVLGVIQEFAPKRAEFRCQQRTIIIHMYVFGPS